MLQICVVWLESVTKAIGIFFILQLDGIQLQIVFNLRWYSQKLVKCKQVSWYWFKNELVEVKSF